MPDDKLFAVYLGGRAPGCNTELHDVVFVTGAAIEDTYEQLLDRWFGAAAGLHIDSWLELDVVDDHRITLSEARPRDGDKLYFVNLGAYDDQFTELHVNRFLVASSANEAKQRAKSEWRSTGPSAVHTDNLVEVDTCLELGAVNHKHVVLQRTDEPSRLRPNNRYHPIPKPVVAAYTKQRRQKKTGP